MICGWKNGEGKVHLTNILRRNLQDLVTNDCIGSGG